MFQGVIIIKFINQVFNGIDSMTEHGLTPREGQENLMLDIAQAMEENQVLIAEAGVGIGKSFAYLMPGLIRSWQTGKPLIVSSSSIQLTEQLVSDVEKVGQILSKPFTYTVGKGRTNYSCFKRYESGSSRFKKDFSSIGALQEAWGGEELTPSEKRGLQVESCLFNRCELRHACEFYTMRQRLAGRGGSSVDCLIVNHNLLVEDLRQKLSGRKGLIEEGHATVIDEAHKFEDVVRDALNTKLSHHDVKKLRRLVEDVRLKRFDIVSLERDLLDLFDTFYTYLSSKYGREAEYVLDNRLDIADVVHGTREMMNKVLINLGALLEALTYHDYDDSREDLYEETVTLAETFHTYLDSLLTERSVYWAVYEREFSRRGLFLCSAPKNIDKFIQKLLFGRGNSVILTSATLGTGDKTTDLKKYYGYQRRTLGLPVRTEYSDPQPSPYDYKSNTRLYVPREEIDVRTDESIESIASEIKRLADVFEGKTLVLFTSKRQLDQVDLLLQEKSQDAAWTLMRQDGTKSVRTLQKEFTDGGGKVLLATGSFWEGVNIKGNALSCLIVVRLPYPVPDPVIQHKTTLIPGTVEDEMMIKLKQGTGRLIRSEEDMGVVAILDSRIIRRPEILSSLAFGPMLRDIQDVEAFVEGEMDHYLDSKKITTMVEY